MITEMMTYKQYMLKTYLNKDNIYGDLAKDLNDDNKFPDDFSQFETLEKYIKRRACSEAMEAFYESYILYIGDRYCDEEIYEQVNIVSECYYKYYGNSMLLNMVSELSELYNEINGGLKK